MRFSLCKGLLTGVLSLLLLAGCASSSGPAPVEARQKNGGDNKVVTASGTAAPVVDRKSQDKGDPRPKTHTVKKGETLYSIALEYGFDYKDLAAWNAIDNIHLIKVGQVLSLVAPEGGVITKPLVDAPVTTTPMVFDEPKAVRLPYSEKNQAQLLAGNPVPDKAKPASNATDTKPAAPAVRGNAPETAASASTGTSSAQAAVDGLAWQWPVQGKVLSQFNQTPQAKGIDISGKKGLPIFASETGKVVYAGSNLRGYGKFVIVKHANEYLSVYAHNDKLLVKEGQQVTKGQKIAEMGDSESDQVKLHFEIRRYGKPVDPIKLLPAR
ncbi:peptidoglycan DD-metalloendopeptidase family protein [Leeia oryzae]|uniref:peptidoglycan DD-metalloendopeptidase family protein n=1 Tax=Leeia oryzae TaxID=356662 RepID=UPI00037B782D|nr:peptidoglycan DD-metalloendopeptidase family protein [Leeia oryzae]